MIIPSNGMDAIRHQQKELRKELNQLMADQSLDEVETAKAAVGKLRGMAALLLIAANAYDEYAHNGGWKGLDECLYSNSPSRG